jgi:hypothetical protein
LPQSLKKPRRLSKRNQLLAGGFQRLGVWRPDKASDSMRFEGENPLPREAGVYAYLVAHEVKYVGSAQEGLHKRLGHYRRPTKSTTVRVRKEILELLANGHDVEVFAIVPDVPEELKLLNGVLPIDTVAGLEGGLIRSMQPPWNKRGRRTLKVMGDLIAKKF